MAARASWHDKLREVAATTNGSTAGGGPTADEALLWFETLKATGWGVGTAATALDESGLGAAKDKLVIG